VKLRVLDLFSGIGGFSLGLERAKCEGQYVGFETVAFCEIEAFPRKVLAKHWPGVTCYDDVRTLTASRLAADGISKIHAITGGFPCQDISVAGKQAGLGEGTRSGLWSECLRLVGELRPKFALFENVAALLSGPPGRSGAWFGRILADLASIGYDAEWENIPAAAMGAPHLRERVWLMAYPAEVGITGPFLGWDNRQNISQGFEARTSMLPPYSHGMVTAPSNYTLRAGDGFSEFLGQLNGYGNAVVPQIPELIGNAILQSLNHPAKCGDTPTASGRSRAVGDTFQGDVA
jgi:DNA (cytosine-5)-methyltransferase 1